MTTAASESYAMTGAERTTSTGADEARRDNETRRRKIGQTGAHHPKADDAHAFDQSIHPSDPSIIGGKRKGSADVHAPISQIINKINRKQKEDGVIEREDGVGVGRREEEESDR
jgi:hypothetical protein